MLPVYRFIATGFGSGYSPLAPGTAGSLAGLLLLYGWQRWAAPDYLIENQFVPLVVAIIVFNMIGVFVTNQVEKDWGPDPPRVVIDEIVGMWIAVLWIPPNLVNWAIAFVLFRFFDIIKPLGIRKMEKIKGGWGVMLDDVLAGVYSNLALQAIYRLAPW